AYLSQCFLRLDFPGCNGLLQRLKVTHRLLGVAVGEFSHGIVEFAARSAVTRKLHGIAGSRMSLRQHLATYSRILRQTIPLHLAVIDTRLVIAQLSHQVITTCHRGPPQEWIRVSLHAPLPFYNSLTFMNEVLGCR